MPTMRILQVDSVTVQITDATPAQAVICVEGMASTPGWGNVRLQPLEKKLSPDGIFDLEFVGDPPSTIVPQVLTRVTASHIMTQDVDRLVGVKVDARTNSMTELVARVARMAGATAAKTAAIGEESLTTFAIGEEGPFPKTIFPGEEGKTFVFTEEGKTLFIGEEGPKTLIRFEEGPKPVFGETDPRVDDPKPPFGENKGPLGEEIDFGFRTPFGRR